ncbi:hypothetical protein BDZ91DRAFT_720875 [Kalaharituber pfeilii]|nr:hypothetical protein BDZ91DRAFT_720875 [Kalaharituber pfeilii]
MNEGVKTLKAPQSSIPWVVEACINSVPEVNHIYPCPCRSDLSDCTFRAHATSSSPGFSIVINYANYMSSNRKSNGNNQNVKLFFYVQSGILYAAPI